MIFLVILALISIFFFALNHADKEHSNKGVTGAFRR